MVADYRPVAVRRQAKNREELRAKFKVGEYVRQLGICHDELADINEQMEKAVIKKYAKPKKTKKKQLKRLALVQMQLELLHARKEIIKAKIDLNLRRLKFCMPELKAIDFTDGDGNNPLNAFAEAVAAMGKG